MNLIQEIVEDIGAWGPAVRIHPGNRFDFQPWAIKVDKKNLIIFNVSQSPAKRIEGARINGQIKSEKAEH